MERLIEFGLGLELNTSLKSWYSFAKEQVWWASSGKVLTRVNKATGAPPLLTAEDKQGKDALNG